MSNFGKHSFLLAFIAVALIALSLTAANQEEKPPKGGEESSTKEEKPPKGGEESSTMSSPATTTSESSTKSTSSSAATTSESSKESTSSSAATTSESSKESTSTPATTDSSESSKESTSSSAATTSESSKESTSTPATTDSSESSKESTSSSAATTSESSKESTSTPATTDSSESSKESTSSSAATTSESSKESTSTPATTDSSESSKESTSTPATTDSSESSKENTSTPATTDSSESSKESTSSSAATTSESSKESTSSSAATTSESSKESTSTPATTDSSESSKESTSTPATTDSSESSKESTSSSAATTSESSKESTSTPATTTSESSEEDTETPEPVDKDDESLEALLKIYESHSQNLTNMIRKIQLLTDVEGLSNLSEFDKHFNARGEFSSDTELPQNCTAATIATDNQDGPYVLNISNPELSVDAAHVSPFYAYCVHEKNDDYRSWMIIQRRQDGSVNFNRNWNDYKYGFGDLYGDYWIGLERVYQVTKGRQYELWVLLKDHGFRESSAFYRTFSVASEHEGYRLTVSDYNGTAGDSLRLNNGFKFSTAEHDLDRDFRNCARVCRGGWWYGTCTYCNLNSYYQPSDDPSRQHTNLGVSWDGTDGPKYSYKYSHMAIRPLLINSEYAESKVSQVY